MVFGVARTWLVALAAAFAAPAFAQDNQLLDDAVALAAIPPSYGAEIASGKTEGPVNLLIAAHRTAAQRYSDSYLTSRQAAAAPGRNVDAAAPPGRCQHFQTAPDGWRGGSRRSAQPSRRSLRWSAPATHSFVCWSRRRAAVRSAISWSTATRRPMRCSCARTAGSRLAQGRGARHQDRRGHRGRPRLAASRDGRARSIRPDGAGRHR